MIFVTCMYNRPLVSELYLLGLNRLRKIKDFKVLIACSDEESVNLCKKHGIDYFEYENKPLGKKHNELFNRAILDYEEEYIVHSGDDDVMSDELFKAYLQIEWENKEEYIKPRGLYFYEPKKNEALTLNDKNLFGAFRMFKKSMLEKVGYQTVVQFKQDVKIGGKSYLQGGNYPLPKYIADYYIEKAHVAKQYTYFNLWNNDLDKSLDYSSESKLIECGIKPHIVDLGSPQVVDVKSNQNIWTIDKFYSHSEKVNQSKVLEIMSKEELKQLELIKIS